MNIISFTEPQHEFLSNFYPVKIFDMGFYFSTVEHAYVANKTTNNKFRIYISNLPADKAGVAKRMGSRRGMEKFGCELVPGWDGKKDYVMLRLLTKKFQNPTLAKKLLRTGGHLLVETNWWHDNYWGDCVCDKLDECKEPGKNRLGIILMNIRTILATGVEL